MWLRLRLRPPTQTQRCAPITLRHLPPAQKAVSNLHISLKLKLFFFPAISCRIIYAFEGAGRHLGLMDSMAQQASGIGQDFPWPAFISKSNHHHHHPSRFRPATWQLVDFPLIRIYGCDDSAALIDSSAAVSSLSLSLCPWAAARIIRLLSISSDYGHVIADEAFVIFSAVPPSLFQLLGLR